MNVRDGQKGKWVMESFGLSLSECVCAFVYGQVGSEQMGRE